MNVIIIQQADEIKYHLRAKSHSGPADFSIVSDGIGHSSKTVNKEPRTKRFKATFDHVPSNILENYEDDDAQAMDDQLADESEETAEFEGLRTLSPPPSEADYIYGLSQGESLAEHFESDAY